MLYQLSLDSKNLLDKYRKDTYEKIQYEIIRTATSIASVLWASYHQDTFSPFLQFEKQEDNKAFFKFEKQLQRVSPLDIKHFDIQRYVNDLECSLRNELALQDWDIDTIISQINNTKRFLFREVKKNSTTKTFEKKFNLESFCYDEKKSKLAQGIYTFLYNNFSNPNFWQETKNDIKWQKALLSEHGCKFIFDILRDLVWEYRKNGLHSHLNQVFSGIDWFLWQLDNGPFDPKIHDNIWIINVISAIAHYPSWMDVIQKQIRWYRAEFADRWYTIGLVKERYDFSEIQRIHKCMMEIREKNKEQYNIISFRNPKEIYRIAQKWMGSVNAVPDGDLLGMRYETSWNPSDDWYFSQVESWVFLMNKFMQEVVAADPTLTISKKVVANSGEVATWKKEDNWYSPSLEEQKLKDAVSQPWVEVLYKHEDRKDDSHDMLALIEHADINHSLKEWITRSAWKKKWWNGWYSDYKLSFQLKSTNTTKEIGMIESQVRRPKEIVEAGLASHIFMKIEWEWTEKCRHQVAIPMQYMYERALQVCKTELAAMRSKQEKYARYITINDKIIDLFSLLDKPDQELKETFDKVFNFILKGFITSWKFIFYGAQDYVNKDWYNNTFPQSIDVINIQTIVSSHATIHVDPWSNFYMTNGKWFYTSLEWSRIPHGMKIGVYDNNDRLQIWNVEELYNALYVTNPYFQTKIWQNDSKSIE